MAVPVNNGLAESPHTLGRYYLASAANLRRLRRECKAGLTDPAPPGERQESSCSKQPFKFAQLVFPSNEARQYHWQSNFTCATASRHTRDRRLRGTGALTSASGHQRIALGLGEPQRLSLMIFSRGAA
jgi:hypothetical protein